MFFNATFFQQYFGYIVVVDIFNYFAYDWTVKSERKVTWLDPKNGMLLDVSVSSKNKDKKRNKKKIQQTSHFIENL
jgi:hypothetical protein